MRKAIRTTLSLVVSLGLCGALTMAHAGGNNADKHKSTKRHSRLAKLAFWRHHKGIDKNAQHDHVTRTQSKQAHARTAQTKPMSAKQSDQKQTLRARKMSKPSPAKALAANKTKPDPTTASLEQ